MRIIATIAKHLAIAVLAPATLIACVNSGPPLFGDTSTGGERPEGWAIGDAPPDIHLMAKTSPYKQTQLSPLSIYDVAKRDGVKLIYLSVVAVWCGPCNDEQPDVQAAHDVLAPEVEFVEVLLEDNDHKPAKEANVDIWGGGTRHPLNGITMALDDYNGERNKQIANFGTGALPVTILLRADNHEIRYNTNTAVDDLMNLLRSHLDEIKKQ